MDEIMNFVRNDATAKHWPFRELQTRWLTATNGRWPAEKSGIPCPATPSQNVGLISL